MATYIENNDSFYLVQYAEGELQFEVMQTDDDEAEPSTVDGDTFVLKMALEEGGTVLLSIETVAVGNLLTFPFTREQLAIAADAYVGTVWAEPAHKPLHPAVFVIPVRAGVGGNT